MKRLIFPIVIATLAISLFSYPVFAHEPLHIHGHAHLHLGAFTGLELALSSVYPHPAYPIFRNHFFLIPPAPVIYVLPKNLHPYPDRHWSHKHWKRFHHDPPKKNIRRFMGGHDHYDR